MNKDNLRDALKSLQATMAFDSRDWSVVRRDAWLYGIVVGWDDALPEVAKKHRWDAVDVARLKRLNSGIKEFLGES